MSESKEIAKAQTSIKYIEKALEDIKNSINDLSCKQRDTMKDIWEIKRKLPEVDKKVDNLSLKHEQSTIRYFIKNNWWKVGGAVLAFSTILGAVGEYLYHLPPPIKK